MFGVGKTTFGLNVLNWENQYIRNLLDEQHMSDTDKKFLLGTATVFVNLDFFYLSQDMWTL
jgi:hypothetical protein